MVQGTWTDRNIGGQAKNNSSNSDSSNSGDATSSGGNAEGQTTGDVEIENKFNDYTQYWDGLDGEPQYKITPDAPDVRIYISRQILPEDEEESETDDDAESKIAGLEDPDITKKNTTIVKDETGQEVLAHKSIDEDVEKEVKKITNSFTKYRLNNTSSTNSSTSNSTKKE